MDISAAIDSATEALRSAGIEGPRREASSLLKFVLEKDAVFLIAHPEYELAAHELSRFARALERRVAREPFQYISVRQEFYGLEFEVNEGVLIPRPETEILVQASIEVLSKLEKPSFFEIGVGSGCISVSILRAVPSAKAVGVDISHSALAVAERNARKLGVAERVEFRKADVFEGLNAKFELIVSNPPYIPDDQIESLQPEVRQFEPLVALRGGREGVEIIQRIIHRSHEFLTPKGFLILEIGIDQAPLVKELFDPVIWECVEFRQDLQGIPRVIQAGLRR